MIDPSRVCAVTVTYGNRSVFVRQVVEAALKSGVRHVIVVDNDSTLESRCQIENMTQLLGSQVHVVHLPANMGSAGGFAIGLQTAMERSPCEYFWLLDDDNVAHENTLSVLLHVYAAIKGSMPGTWFGLQCFRPLQWGSSILARTRPIRRWRSTFLGFHVVFLLRWGLRALRLSRAGSGTLPSVAWLEIPCGTYGGLFISRRLVELIGYPDTRLFVYADDTEYTSRICRVGGKLFVVPGSVLSDITQNDYTNAGQKSSPVAALRCHVVAEDVDRVYYNVRNQAYVEWNRSERSLCIYMLNKVIVVLVLCAYSLRFLRLLRLRLILRAINDGERGILGKLSGRISGG